MRRGSSTHTIWPMIRRSSRRNPWKTRPTLIWNTGVATPLYRHITDSLPITHRALKLRVRFTRNCPLPRHHIFLKLFLNRFVNCVPKSIFRASSMQSPFLLQLFHRASRKFLTIHLLQHILLPRLMIADTDQDASGDIARDATAENHSREGEGSDVV